MHTAQLGAGHCSTASLLMVSRLSSFVLALTRASDSITMAEFAQLAEGLLAAHEPHSPASATGEDSVRCYFARASCFWCLGGCENIRYRKKYGGHKTEGKRAAGWLTKFLSTF